MFKKKICFQNIPAEYKNYIKTTDKEVGLLLNFGRTPEFKRVIFTNDRKE